MRDIYRKGLIPTSPIFVEKVLYSQEGESIIREYAYLEGFEFVGILMINPSKQEAF